MRPHFITGFVILFIFVNKSFCEPTIYATRDNNHSTSRFVEIFQDTAYVIEVTISFRRHINEYSTKFLDTLYNQNMFFQTQFVGSLYKIKEQEGHLYLNNLINNRLSKLFQFNGKLKDYYQNINSGLLDLRMNSLNKEMQNKFPFYYDYCNFFDTVSKLDNHLDLSVPYKDFIPGLEKFVFQYKDSLMAQNTLWSEKFDSIISNVNDMSYSHFKGLLLKLPIIEKNPSSYFKKAFVKFMIVHPHHFFTMVDDVPELRDLLINLIIYEKELYQKILDVAIDSPLKKEIKKRKRKNMAFSILAISAFSAYGAALLTGSYFLGRSLVRVF